MSTSSLAHDDEDERVGDGHIARYIAAIWHGCGGLPLEPVP
jgi:hypothetical protein